MAKFVINILQGSAVIQAVLGGLTIYPKAENFLQCICQNYQKLGWQETVIAKISSKAHFVGLPCRQTIIVNIRVIFHK